MFENAGSQCDLATLNLPAAQQLITLLRANGWKDDLLQKALDLPETQETFLANYHPSHLVLDTARADELRASQRHLPTARLESKFPTLAVDISRFPGTWGAERKVLMHYSSIVANKSCLCISASHIVLKC